jgi:hypothetical protein
MIGKQTEDEAFVLEYRMELALAYLKRSDESATVFRTVVFTACSAAIVFIVSKYDKGIAPHLPALVFLAVAAIFVLLSWDLQKGKAIKRFRALRAKDLDAYFALDDGNPNYGLDRYAAVLLVIGIILEGFELLKPTL